MSIKSMYSIYFNIHTQFHIFVHFLSSISFAYVSFEGNFQEDRDHAFHVHGSNSIA